jgi:hypothetical protein
MNVSNPYFSKILYIHHCNIKYSILVYRKHEKKSTYNLNKKVIFLHWTYMELLRTFAGMSHGSSGWQPSVRSYKRFTPKQGLEKVLSTAHSACRTGPSFINNFLISPVLSIEYMSNPILIYSREGILVPSFVYTLVPLS